MQDLPYGSGISSVGDVLIIEARGAVFAQTEQDAPGRLSGPYLSELSFPGRRPC
ncbi:hypothetical protein SBDP2_940003 [Syntrophobacter sp. SbD2]|nr:hypothetical protein SBDP2_940003 [Syntrophobacter sp. SbD2]